VNLSQSTDRRHSSCRPKCFQVHTSTLKKLLPWWRSWHSA